MIGFSTKVRKVCVYHFDGMTKEFVGKEVVEVPPHTGLPADCCLVAPPSDKPGFVQIWNGSAWDYIEDSRGCLMYHKHTGEPMELRNLGPIPGDYVTEKPIENFVKWDGEKWVQDIAARKNAISELAIQRKNAEISYAQELIRPLEFAAKLEIATELEKKNLEALMTYIVLLNRINTDDAEKIDWPELSLSL